MVPDRKLTPGAGRYTFVDTEEPTRPGVPKPADRFDTMARLMANLTPAERTDLMSLADNWYRCTANRRALLQASAAEYAG